MTKRLGFTTVIENEDTIKIYHGGNMGNSIKESVNPNLIKLGYPTINKLKIKYKTYREDGSPDYMYQAVFYK